MCRLQHFMTAPAKINKSRIVLFCLLAAAVLLAISPFAATRAVNTAFVKNRLAAQIEKQTDLKLEISDFSIALLPLPGVRMKNLSVRPLEGVQIKIGAIAFTVDLHQLLKKKIGIGKIALEKPVFEFDLASQVQNSKNAPAPVDLAKLFDHLDDAFTFLPEDQKSLIFDIEAARGPFFDDMDAAIMFQRNQRRFRVDITLARVRFSPGCHWRA